MRVYTGHHCHITVVYPYINTHSHIRKNISSTNIKSAYKMAIKASIKCVQEAAPSECISPLRTDRCTCKRYKNVLVRDSR